MIRRSSERDFFCVMEKVINMIKSNSGDSINVTVTCIFSKNLIIFLKDRTSIYRLHKFNISLLKYHFKIILGSKKKALHFVIYSIIRYSQFLFLLAEAGFLLKKLLSLLESAGKFPVFIPMQFTQILSPTLYIFLIFFNNFNVELGKSV